MTSEEWNSLMRRARKLAACRGERVRIRACILRDGKTTPLQWGYVIECPSYCIVCERKAYSNAIRT